MYSAVLRILALNCSYLQLIMAEVVSFLETLAYLASATQWLFGPM